MSLRGGKRVSGEFEFKLLRATEAFREEAFVDTWTKHSYASIVLYPAPTVATHNGGEAGLEGGLPCYRPPDLLGTAQPDSRSLFMV